MADQGFRTLLTGGVPGHHTSPVLGAPNDPRFYLSKAWDLVVRMNDPNPGGFVFFFLRGPVLLNPVFSILESPATNGPVHLQFPFFFSSVDIPGSVPY